MQTGHAERPDRLRAINQYLSATGLLDRLEQRTAAPVDDLILATVHDPAYLASLKAMSPKSGIVAVDPDTAMCPATLTAAHLAAGAVADAVRAVLAGEAQTAFCAVRPPGHHAERDAAMGFCFYNNVAVGASVALSQPGIERVAILDFDVHHGNGTVNIFADRPEVLVCSTFQHPFYPNRYHEIERPNIVNTPLPAGTGSRDYRAAVEAAWLPALQRHRPDLILVSAGFDAHKDDPLAELELTEADYTWITTLITDAAARYSHNRVVSTLEGGYDLNALARSVAAHVEVLASPP
ncbi:MAG: histone deacetylase family protein [Pseudomonadales bacterium]|jgi:acetoin utilization deacetylase AcuC-like enzyme